MKVYKPSLLASIFVLRKKTKQRIKIIQETKDEIALKKLDRAVKRLEKNNIHGALDLVYKAITILGYENTWNVFFEKYNKNFRKSKNKSETKLWSQIVIDD